MSTSGYNAYQRAQAEEMDQAKLVLMMYAGAVNYLDKALEVGAADTSESGRFISRTKNIILELMSSLDIEQGGQMGELLWNTYQALFAKLNKAHLQDNFIEVREVRDSLAELQDSWKQVFSGPEYEQFKQARLRARMA